MNDLLNESGEAPASQQNTKLLIINNTSEQFKHEFKNVMEELSDSIPYVSGEDLENWFSHHPPMTKEIVEKYNTIREQAKNFAHYILENCPDSAERCLAIDKLRECVMWANASIACNGDLIDEEDS